MSRLFPLIAIVLLALTAAVWRPWVQRRRHGQWGVHLFRSGGALDPMRDAAAVLLFLLMLGQALAVALRDEPPSLVIRIDLSPLGARLMVAGLVLAVVAQLNLGRSWRIGIDESASPGLVTRGAYSFCRNPIFLGLLLFVLGYAMSLPTRLSLILLIAFYVGVRMQIAAEEKYLTRVYGEAFTAYARRVGRFVPWIGRRR